MENRLAICLGRNRDGTYGVQDPHGFDDIGRAMLGIFVGGVGAATGITGAGLIGIGWSGSGEVFPEVFLTITGVPLLLAGLAMSLIGCFCGLWFMTIMLAECADCVGSVRTWVGKKEVQDHDVELMQVN